MRLDIRDLFAQLGLFKHVDDAKDILLAPLVERGRCLFDLVFVDALNYLPPPSAGGIWSTRDFNSETSIMYCPFGIDSV